MLTVINFPKSVLLPILGFVLVLLNIHNDVHGISSAGLHKSAAAMAAVIAVLAYISIISPNNGKQTTQVTNGIHSEAQSSIPVKSEACVSIVVVGAGLIGPRHAHHVNANPNTKLFGIIDLNPDTAKVAESLGTNYFNSLDQMVEFCRTNNIDLPKGGIICTPNHTHVKVASQLANLGINILVEKPVSPLAEEAKALKIFCNSKKVKVLVGHHRRFNPFIMAAKKHLEKIGDPVAIQGSWTLKKDDEYFKISPWRTNRNTGGGPLLINLVHDLDLLQYLLGPISRVYAEMLPQKREYDNVDEGAVLTLRFKSGVCGTFVCSDNVPSPFNFESSTGENPTVPHHGGVHGLYRIFGTEGTLSVPDLNLYSNSSWTTSVDTKPLVDTDKLMGQKPFDAQLSHFLDIINNNQVPNCNIDDGISALLVIKSVEKSISTGLPQIVPDITEITPDFVSLDIDEKSLQLA